MIIQITIGINAHQEQVAELCCSDNDRIVQVKYLLTAMGCRQIGTELLRACEQMESGAIGSSVAFIPAGGHS